MRKNSKGQVINKKGHFVKGFPSWNTGRSWKNEFKAQVSETKKKQVLQGIGVGLRNGNYKHGKDWRTLKRLALIKYDFACQCTGKCAWHKGKCGFRDLEIMQFDHIKPRKIYPELEFEELNHQILCPNCHAIKTNQDKKHIVQLKKKRMNSGEPLTDNAEGNPEPSSIEI